MGLEVMGRLPEGARAMLEVPVVFYEMLHARHQLAKVRMNRECTTAFIPVNPRGRTRFDEILFPARSRAKMRLLVHIPERMRKRTYRVAVRQLWEGEEVGRVTWQLQPQQTLKEVE